MSQPVIYVKVPFGYGNHRFKLFKGQRWGAIDQLLLQAITEEPRSSQKLSDESGLPRQLIIEIMIPLMQVGWVELVQLDNYYAFQATERGRIVANSDELPVDREHQSKLRSFLIDPITQQCYRFERRKKKQIFQVYNHTRVNGLLSNHKKYTTEINVSSQYKPSIVDIFNSVANDDEEVFDFDESVIKRSYIDSLKYAIAVVSNDNEITGVSEISSELREVILKAAHKKRELVKLLGDEGVDKGSRFSAFNAKSIEKYFSSHNISSDQFTVILGAEEHKNHLYEMIENAKTRIVIHSTFINPISIDEVMPALISAARRSVQIDILWGQTEPEEESKITAYQTVIEKIAQVQSLIDNEGLATQFVIHKNPSQSHAKFIIADHCNNGFCVTFGSCNWLATRFNRLEASVCIYQIGIVADALEIASRLAMGAQGVTNGLSKELATLSNILRGYYTNSDFINNNSSVFKVRLISAAEHHSIVKVASKEARDEIFICSHRVSYAGERPILTPLIAAIKEMPSLMVKVSYGRNSGGMNNREADALANTLKSMNIQVSKANTPQIHAKLMTWDNDNLVITSLNWLSAAATGDIYSEIGVFLQGNNVAEKVRVIFDGK